MADDWMTPIPSANRPPAALPLRDFPRPPKDNGRGIHFGLDVRDDFLSSYGDRMKELGIKWCLYYVGDEMQAMRAAYAALKRDIMPVIRLKGKINGQAPFKQTVNTLGAMGVRMPYIQIYNEPGDPREWAGSIPRDYREVFGRNWARAAIEVYDAGACPGIQILGEDELVAAVDALTALNRMDVWGRTFFALHNYGVNHPPAYPYDMRNQVDHPRATISDDDTCVLNFIEFGRWCVKHIGYVLPMIGGEGGWIYGAHEDRRYEKCEADLHAQYHVEMFGWFATGLLSNGQALPDWLFSVAPWLLFGIAGEAEAWLGGALGDKTQTLRAVQSIPEFTRDFSWDKVDLDRKSETEAAVEAAINQIWIPINRDSALLKKAGDIGMGFVHTDEFYFDADGKTFVGQMFENGLLYAQLNHWDDIRFIPRYKVTDE